MTSFDGFSLDDATTRAIAADNELQGVGRKPTMFKILELKGDSMHATEVGRGHSRREEALAAVKKHLKTFKVSGHNPEANYWWARDSEGLRKCWIASIK